MPKWYKMSPKGQKWAITKGSPILMRSFFYVIGKEGRHLKCLILVPQDHGTNIHPGDGWYDSHFAEFLPSDSFYERTEEPSFFANTTYLVDNFCEKIIAQNKTMMDHPPAAEFINELKRFLGSRNLYREPGIVKL